MRWRRLIGLLVLTIATGLVARAMAADAPPQVEVRMAASRGYDVYSLARARGTLDKALLAKGIKVTWLGPFPALAPQIEAMNAGDLDFGAGSSTAFAAALSGDAPIVVFGYLRMQPSFEGILVAGNSPLKQAQDLIGKKVAVNRGGTGEYLLLKALETFHIPFDKVTRVYLGPSDGASAFGLGQVDAWAVWDPFNSIAQVNHGARILVASDAIASDNAIVTVVQADFLKKHPDVTRLVFQALQQEDEWAATHADEASVIWAKAMGLSPEIGKMLASHANLPMTAVGKAEAAQIERAARWMYDHKMIPAPPNVPAHVVDLSAPAK